MIQSLNHPEEERHPGLKLTPELLEDVNLPYEASRVVWDYLGRYEEHEHYEAVRKLPQHWRAICTVLSYEGEVYNGGHHQFFWNSDGALNKETLEDLKYIGATIHAKIFEGALAEYDRYDYQDEKADSDDSKEAFLEGYHEERMKAFDTRFYAQEKTLGKYMTDHILAHRDLYL